MAEQQKQNPSSPQMSMDEQMLYNLQTAVNDEQQQIQGALQTGDALSEALGRLDMYTDKSTGEMRPFFADGTSPATPINESPVSGEDRLKLSLGNKQGSINYLKNKYEDAAVDPKGNLVVKQEGLWKRVDAEGWGSGDAWSKTKEVLKDIVDVTPEVATVAATLPIVGTGAGAIAASGAVTGAAGAIRTSLGRLAGTYEATPEEQIADIGIESLLGLGGATFAAGVKPGFDVLKKGLGGLAKTFGAMPEGIKKGYAEVFGAMTGAGADNVERAFARGDAIANHIKTFAKAGPTTDASIQLAREAQVDLTTQLLPTIRAGLTEMYENNLTKIASEVPDTAFFNPRDFVDDVARNFQSAGILSKGKQGFLELPKNPLDFAQAAKRSLDPNLTALADEIAVDPTIYRAIKRSVEGVVNMPSKSARGAKGLVASNEALKQVKSITGAAIDAIGKGRNVPPKAASDFLLKLKGDTQAAMTNYVKRNAGETAGLQFAKLSKDYADASNALRPALNASKKLMKNRSDEASQTFINRYLSGEDVVTKKAIREAIGLLKNTSKGRMIREIDDKILDIEAARAFLPRTRDSFFQFGAPIGVATGVAAGNPLIAATFGASAAMTSPRLAFRGAQAMGAISKFASLPTPVKQAGVKEAWAVKDLISEAAKRRGIQKLTQQDLRTLGQILAQAVGSEIK